jgi:hypothetical protein
MKWGGVCIAFDNAPFGAVARRSFALDEFLSMMSYCDARPDMSTWRYLVRIAVTLAGAEGGLWVLKGALVMPNTLVSQICVDVYQILGFVRALFRLDKTAVDGSRHFTYQAMC